MNYWPWWLSGIALSGVMIFHWFSTGRMMAVSGRFTSLIDRFRHGSVQPEEEVDPAALLAALQAATAEEFGEDDAEANAEATPSGSEEGALPALPSSRPPSQHFVFFAALVLGGFFSTLLAGNLTPTLWLNGELFKELGGGSSSGATLLLLGGGILVGFGTRMAGGCTSGHGLCGVSRFQPGSLVATAAFFGAGILTSLLLGAL